ncbi:MAG: hypothetical protein R6X34_02380 [Chloroflexota bacterium]
MVKNDEELLMYQAVEPHNHSPSLNQIIKIVPQLSQKELLELIAYLAQQAQATAVAEPNARYQWHDLAGAAPDLLAGRDAQEWVNQVRADEWDRHVP